MARFGRRLTIASGILLVLCVAPIMLYAAFGPPDGNPIGLGLLMVFGGPVFAVLGLVGLGLWIAGRCRASNGEPRASRRADSSG